MSTQRENVTELIWESSTKTDADPGGRLSRPASGALVGLVLGAVYTLVASTIDAVLMRDVPIRLDWPAVWGAAALGGLSGAALGALTAWPEVGWKGVLAGAAGFVAWSFAKSYLKLQAAAFLFLPLFVPLMMMSLPLAGLLRWGAGRQVQLQAESGWARWRAQVLLLALVLAVGGFAGSWSQMPASAQAAVRTVHGASRLAERLARRTVTTGCGQGSVFGDLMAELDRLRLPDAAITQAQLYAIVNTMRLQDSTYKSSGSVHGCALFRGEHMAFFVEDVGRHNAVDTIAGWMGLQGEPMASAPDKVFYTTGRLTSEMVIKAAQMGVPIVVSRSGITQMGLQLARRLGLCAVGRALNRRFLCYSAPERLGLPVPPHGA